MPGINDEKEHAQKSRARAKTAKQEAIQEKDRYAASKGHRQPQRDLVDAQRQQKRHTEVGIESVLAATPGNQMDGITNPVAVNAVFKNGIGVVPCTRLILIKPSRQ